jgi:hypothetical protein
MMSERQVILILGMHRSGTSVLTRTLALCGADLPKSTCSITEITRDTHWEPDLIVRMHDEQLLEPEGRRWRDIDWVPKTRLESGDMGPLRARLVSAFREEFGNSTLPVFKDPRLCRLLPLWLPIIRELGATPSAVMLVRSPLEVAASLRARDRMPARHALWLWLRHFLEAERDSRALPRCWVSYEQVLENWRSVVERTGHQLAVDLRPRSKQAGEELAQFVSSGVRRSRISTEETLNRADVPGVVKQAYAWAIQACRGQQPDLSALDQISATLANHDRALMPFRSAYRAWRRVRPQAALS